MVVDFGEVEVFEGQVYKARDDLIFADAVGLEVSQNGAQPRFVDGDASDVNAVRIIICALDGVKFNGGILAQGRKGGMFGD